VLIQKKQILQPARMHRPSRERWNAHLARVSLHSPRAGSVGKRSCRRVEYFRRDAVENRKRTDIASLSTLQSIATALTVSLSMLFAATEERRDCSFVRAKQGVIIERRGTKVGHVYQLLDM